MTRPFFNTKSYIWCIADTETLLLQPEQHHTGFSDESSGNRTVSVNQPAPVRVRFPLQIAGQRPASYSTNRKMPFRASDPAPQALACASCYL